MTRKQKKALWRIIISAVLLIICALLPIKGAARAACFMVPYFIAGWDVLWSAARNIARGRVFDEKFLMALATIGAIAIGEYPEAVFVMVFFQIGELFEKIAVGKSRKSIAALMEIRPDTANLEKDGGVIRVDPEEVAVGDVIIVKPGEKIPLDGVVIEGTSSLNTTALTGESLPRDVEKGDSVISGCVNMSGLLRVRVSKSFGESTVAKILRLVEESAESKSRSETFITRFAAYYTPCVVIAAALLAIVPPVFFGNWSSWINRALIFLVVSCPCALVISVPLSYFGGIGGASKKGILVKGSAYLDALAKCGTVVFDKTGTLSKGSFTVTGVYAADMEEKELLRLAAMAETFSDHPAARALRDACGEKWDAGRVKDVSEAAGRGVSANADGKAVLAGNARLMEENGIEAPKVDFPGTVIHTAVDGKYAGYIVISDTMKPDAVQAISELKALGVGQTVILSGDRQENAENAAAALGIDRVFAQLLPQQKVEALEKLLEERAGEGSLVFVGDGINDAPVLARADVGIAMGALGSDAAIEAADIVLMDDKPSKAAEALRIARRTRRIVIQNIVFALGVKLIVMALGALGLASMWAASFADVGVCVIAVVNAMRAMK